MAIIRPKNVPVSNLSGTLTNAQLPTLTGTKLPNGTILQTLQSIKTDTATISGGASYTIASVVITASSSTSKFYLSAHVNGYAPYDTNLYFTRNGTVIGQGDAAASRSRGFGEMNGSPRINEQGTTAGFYLDSPGTTSPITYALVLYNASATTYINRSQSDTDAGYDSRTTSTLTVFEIKA